MADVLSKTPESPSASPLPPTEGPTAASDAPAPGVEISVEPDERDVVKAARSDIEENQETLEPEAKQAELSDVERIKAAHAARRSRRDRGAAPVPADESPDHPASVGEEKDDNPVVAKLKAAHAAEILKLRQDSSNLRLELSSLRRNHLQNIKKLTEERDMFALQLAKEQEVSSKPGVDTKQIDDKNVQLRAARTRNNDLENENAVLREDVKQLNFRIQASKTIDAATDGYEKIVSDLVEVKLKCALLEEEKEELLRMNKELSSTSHVLRQANGELEKSRSDWVVRCADLERKCCELKAKSNDKETAPPPGGSDPSDSGSLQDITLH